MIIESGPLVSVVIPAYNHDKYIVQAIESVIAQTYRNIELLIVNDGSTDSTHQQIERLLEECKNRFIRFEYQNNSNKGLVNVLNNSLKWANGIYYAPLASDDAWLPCKIAIQVERLEQKPESQMCFGRAILIDEKGNLTKEQTNNIFYKGGMIFEDLILMRFHPQVNYMWRKAIFEVVGPYQVGIVQEDFYMNLKVSEHHPVEFIDCPISYYRIYSSMVFKRDPVRLYDCYSRILELFKGHPLYGKAMNEYRIRRFWTFSGFLKYKLEAISLLFKLRPGESNDKILKGIIKCFVCWKS